MDTYTVEPYSSAIFGTRLEKSHDSLSAQNSRPKRDTFCIGATFFYACDSPGRPHQNHRLRGRMFLVHGAPLR